MPDIARKLDTAFKVFRAGGVKGIWDTTLTRVRELSRRRPGGLVKVDGCRISVARVAEDVRYLLFSGDYESGERRAVRDYLDPTLPVIEIGASIGVVSCIVNRRLRSGAHHIVVEANPRLIPLLEENGARNGARFRVVNAALAYGRETVEFPVDDNSLLSSAYRDTGQTAIVPAVQLESIRRQSGFDHFTLICDVEGAEAELFRNEVRCIAEHADTVIVELHPGILGVAESERITQLLLAANLRIVRRDGDVYTFRNSRFHAG